MGDGQPWVQRLGAPGAGWELGRLVLGLVPALQQTQHPGALPLAFLQSLGEGLAGSGGELPPQEVLCARSPSRASLLCPSHGHPDSVNAWSLHLGVLPCKHTLHPPPRELAPVGLQQVHSWSRRRIQLQMPQQ